MSDHTKVDKAFESNPLQLSSLLMMNTLQRYQIHARLTQHQLTNAKQDSKWVRTFFLKSIQKSHEQTAQNIESLRSLLRMHKDNHDLPVAFASNALYVLERNDARTEDVYDSVLIPIITNKIDYLHIEGVGQAVWSLAQAG
jgi:hypothetical protein